MAGPTQNAEFYLRLNTTLLQTRAKTLDNEVLAMALLNISEALIQLSVGMRATYNELEELKRIVHPATHSARSLLTAR